MLFSYKQNLYNQLFNGLYVVHKRGCSDLISKEDFYTKLFEAEFISEKISKKNRFAMWQENSEQDNFSDSSISDNGAHTSMPLSIGEEEKKDLEE